MPFRRSPGALIRRTALLSFLRSGMSLYWKTTDVATPSRISSGTLTRLARWASVLMFSWRRPGWLVFLPAMARDPPRHRQQLFGLREKLQLLGGEATLMRLGFDKQNLHRHFKSCGRSDKHVHADRPLFGLDQREVRRRRAHP